MSPITKAGPEGSLRPVVRRDSKPVPIVAIARRAVQASHGACPRLPEVAPRSAPDLTVPNPSVDGRANSTRKQRANSTTANDTADKDTRLIGDDCAGCGGPHRGCQASETDNIPETQRAHVLDDEDSKKRGAYP